MDINNFFYIYLKLNSFTGDAYFSQLSGVLAYAYQISIGQGDHWRLCTFVASFQNQSASKRLGSKIEAKFQTFVTL